MASSSSASMHKSLKDELIDAGNGLLNPGSSTNMLLELLSRVEDLLDRVERSPSIEMQEALLPSVRALISDCLFKHSDDDIKVSVLLCVHKLMRLTPPHIPFSSKFIKEIFQLTRMAIEKLCAPGRCYFKALRLVENLTQVNPRIISLMLGMDPLAVELFQLFLSTISSKYPPAVFTNMRNYMTWMIEQSHHVSTELLLPLLESVKMENQDVLPHSWKLGEEVLRNSAAKVKPYLKELVKSLKLNLDDYAEIVKSICQDGSSAEIMVKEDLADGENGNVLDDEYYMKDRDLDYQIEHGETGTLSNFEVENSTYVGEDESEMEAEVFGGMHDTEMTINLELDYDSSWSDRGESSSVPFDNENEEIEISNLLMELVAQEPRPQAIVDHNNEFIQTPSNDNLGASIVFENYQRMDAQAMRESMVNQSDGLQLLLEAASFLDMVIR